MSKRRKNNLQLRLTSQNEALAERIMHEYLFKHARTLDWTTFGNMLIERGIQSVKKELSTMRIDAIERTHHAD